MSRAAQLDDRPVQLALPLVEQRHDRALDDLLEVRRLAMSGERRLVRVDARRAGTDPDSRRHRFA